MAETEKKPEYSFEFKCSDFEIVFRGDLNFVQNQLRKYEPKVLVKLNQLVPGGEPPLPQQSQPQPNAPAPPPAPKPHFQDNRRKYRDKRGGYRGRREEQYSKDKEEKSLSREPDFVENRGGQMAEAQAQADDIKKPEIEAPELRFLLERYHPRTSHDRIMLFSFYLGDKIEEFSASDIQACYQVLGEKAPSNLSVVLNNASRSGFLSKEEKAGKTRFRLTFKGKRYVENGLRLD